jgi:hypothetical protein
MRPWRSGIIGICRRWGNTRGKRRAFPGRRHLPFKGESQSMGNGTGGGKATHSGTDYQNRSAAWIAVLILAERDSALPLGLPAGVTLESIRCETDQPVDDTLARTSANGQILIQAKHTIGLETKEDSELASVVDQFVRQYLFVRSGTPEAVPSGRMLDPYLDRFVLVTSSKSSAPLRVDLSVVLRRLRELAPHRKGGTVESIAMSDAERHAFRVVRDHLARSWLAETGSVPTNGEVGFVLELVHVLVLDLDPDETHDREARTILRTSILKDPSRADAAWGTLISRCALCAKGRSGVDRAGLQRLLMDATYDLNAPWSYRADIDRLSRHSQDTFARFDNLATISVGRTNVKIDRPCTAALTAIAQDTSLVVVGEPGAGKSVSLYEATAALKWKGRDVVYLAADSLASESLGELRAELNLDHDLVDVLANWPGAATGILVIDALDSARSDGSSKTLRDLIGATFRAAERWRVVASIREFDLRYSAELQRLFRGPPVAGFAHPQFGTVSHLLVPRLDEDELAQVRTQAPDLCALLDSTQEKLRDLLRVAFNLRLMGELLGQGVPTAELTPIRTQLELLDRYWLHRVVRDDRYGDSREAVLRLASESMVAARSLRASRNTIARDPAAGGPLGEVLSCGVLVEWQSPRRVRPDREFLAYSHHVLHDYAIARLLFRGSGDELIRQLGGVPDLAMSIRPSLVMHYQYLWALDADHREFWEVSKRVQLAPDIPEIARTVGPVVAAGLLEAVEDCDPIIDDLGVSRGS